MAYMKENTEQDELKTERKGAGFPEIIVTVFMALFIIFIFVQIVFL
jgi:hypothetical protein